jgi:hypothetical protein
MIDESREQDAFAARVSAKLRDPEQADAAFVERVMAGVVGSVAERPVAPAWWRRRRTLRVTPVSALALAAGIALAVVSLNAAIFRERPRATPVAAAQTDTVYLVRFVFTNDAARAVTIVGTFNDWTKDATPMARQGGAGVWAITLPLRNGRHEYAFVVRDERGERWVADSAALIRRDEFGTESSIVSVGAT